MSIVPTEKPAESVAHQIQVPRVSEMRIYSHSTIFYWWPVWVIGYVMAAITFAEGSRAVVVPAGSVYDVAQHAIVLPAGSADPGIGGSELGQRSAESKNLGCGFHRRLALGRVHHQHAFARAVVWNRRSPDCRNDGHIRVDGRVAPDPRFLRADQHPHEHGFLRVLFQPS